MDSPRHLEYEIDLPHIQHVSILGATKCKEILWCKDDIEIMVPMPTPTPTLVDLVAQKVIRAMTSVMTKAKARMTKEIIIYLQTRALHNVRL